MVFIGYTTNGNGWMMLITRKDIQWMCNEVYRDKCNKASLSVLCETFS